MKASSERPSLPSRFVREKYFPKSWNTGAERFVSLFNRYGYIYKPISGGSWLSAQENWQLSDTEILKAIACVHPKFYIGARSGRATRFAVIDIDAKSRYHRVEEVKRLVGVLYKAGIEKVVPYRSSHSGGWHIYIFFEEQISCRDLNKQLNLLMKVSGFSVQNGQLEIFPNPGASGSLSHGLRLPLQPGFAWLDPKTYKVEIERDELQAMEALDLFLNDLDSESNSYRQFHQLKRYVEDIVERKERIIGPIKEQRGNLYHLRRERVNQTEASELVCEIFGHMPPGIIAEVWQRGRDYYFEGLTGPSQRADAIFAVGHYLFYGDPEKGLSAQGYGYEQERQWLIERFLEDKNNGQSKDIRRGRADAKSQIVRATHWIPAAKREVENQKYTGEVPISWVLENQKRKSKARQKIKEAVEEFRQSGMKFTGADIQRKTKCSWTTLKKHEDIWKTEYEQIAEEFFASSTHEYNAVEGAVCSENQPTSETKIEVVPAGLLAARRIVSEIEFRRKREARKKEKRKVGEQVICENAWRESVEANLPPPDIVVGVVELRKILTFLTWRRSTAPNYESELWISGLIVTVQDNLRKLLLLEREVLMVFSE